MEKEPWWSQATLPFHAKQSNRSRILCCIALIGFCLITLLSQLSVRQALPDASFAVPARFKAPSLTSNQLYVQHIAHLRSSHPSSQKLSTPTSTVAWVVSAIEVPGRSVFEYAETIAQISCYCSQHGIPFFLELANFSRPDVEQGAMTYRHYAAEKHLRNYDWVFFTDLDVFIADSNIDIRTYLDPLADVIIGDRENGELCACAYMVQNTPGGFAFLQRWIEWGTGRKGANGDNGDLLEMTLAGMAVAGFGESSGSSRAEAIESMPTDYQAGRNEDVNDNTNWTHSELQYSEVYIPTFDRAVSSIRNADPRAISWSTQLFPTSRTPTDLKVLKPYSGFIRTAGASVEDEDPSTRGYGNHAVLGDFLMHAKNAKLRITEDMVRCNHRGWRVSHWMPLEEARVKLIAGGYPNYVGCHIADNNTLTYVC